MELKEIAGDRDLYDAMKQQKRKQKKIDGQAANRGKVSVKKNIFDFLNQKLLSMSLLRKINSQHLFLLI